MCKRNSPHKNKSQHGMCKRNSLDKKEEKKSNMHGMCKSNSPKKNQASVGCVRENPHKKIKPAWDV